MKTYRNFLTDNEYAAFVRLTQAIKVDGCFDLFLSADGSTYGIDFENQDREVDLRTVLGWVADAMAYKPTHDGLSKEEEEIIFRVIREFDLAEEYWFKNLAD